MKRALTLRRILYGIALTGALVLIGFRGGAASFLVFWCLLLMPVFSLAFRKIVRTGLEIRLEVEDGSVVRGEKLPCTLKLINDTFLPIPEVRIVMSEGKIRFRPEEITLRCSLRPGEQREFHFEPLCAHCGRARIGATSITVPDYFSLLEITYERIERVNILPRQQRVDSLLIAPPREEERRKVDKSYFGDHVPDGQWRLYMNGDDLRRVNWKLSARQQQLIMKNLIPEPKNELILIPDGRETIPDGRQGWIAEDSIVEGTLAIADYFLRRGIALEVVPDPYRRISLAQSSSYQQLYKMMSRGFFSGTTRTDEALLMYEKQKGTGSYILLTWEIDEAFIRNLSDPILRGSDITLVYIGEDTEAPALAGAQKKLSFYQVTSENDIFSALKGHTEGGGVR